MLTRFNRMSAAVLSGVTASLLVMATDALAQGKPVVVYAQPTPVNTVRVPYRDLNLASSSDRKLLKSRVGQAVRKVCEFNHNRLDRGYFLGAGDAWAGARPQIVRAIAGGRDLAVTGSTSITVRAR